MTNLFNPNDLKTKQIAKPFWCKICIDKTKQFKVENDSENYFFSHNVIPENKANKAFLRDILR